MTHFARVALLLLCCHLVLAQGCERKAGAGDTQPFSSDETYLIDAYVRVRNARGFYPQQPAIAESLFTILGADVDSVRVNNIVATINRTPERWNAIFGEIEKRLRAPSKRTDS